MGYPWFVLYHWEPFHIDALGLVTLLGPEEVNAYLGRLVPSRWLEYMPLLGAFVIAGDRFKDKMPSFNIYNISSGINTSDLSSWFTRWMLAQELEVSRSVVYWEVIEKPRKWWPYHVIAGTISFCFTGFLVAMTVLSKDWYGFANAVAMVISIIVRAYILQANRNAINKAVLKAQPGPGTSRHAVKEWNKNRAVQSARPLPDGKARSDGTPLKSKLAKIMIVMSDAKAVTMFIPEQLIIPVFVHNPKPQTEWLYTFLRWVGWAAFAVHIIAIGMTKLAAQMYTVALLVIPTVLICWKIGCDDSRRNRRFGIFSGKETETPYECWIGSHLKATVFEWPKDAEFDNTKGDDGVWQRLSPNNDQKRSTRRQDLYAWLNLTAEEEDSMGKWDLLPHRRNNDDTWSNDYNAKKELIRANPTDIRATKNAITREIEQSRNRTWLCGGKRAQKDDLELVNHAAAQPDDPLEPKTVQRVNVMLSASGVPTSSTSAAPAIQRT
jgi:hypothetical protein